jgi:hypothetical protein
LQVKKGWQVSYRFRPQHESLDSTGMPGDSAI